MKGRCYLYCLVLGMSVLGAVLPGCSKKQGAVSPPTPPPVDTPVSSQVLFYLTESDKSALFSKQNIGLNFSNSSSGSVIIVDSTKSYQSIDGFGYTLTGGSATLINQLPAADKDALLKELFLTDSNHIGVSYLRISIGASD